MASLRRHGSQPAVLGRPPARNGRCWVESRFLRRDGIARACWPPCQTPLVVAMWRVLILFVLLLVACQHRRADFMTRVMEDCTTGDQWACDLLNSLAKDRTARGCQTALSSPETSPLDVV